MGIVHLDIEVKKGNRNFKATAMLRGKAIHSIGNRPCEVVEKLKERVKEAYPCEALKVKVKIV